MDFNLDEFDKVSFTAKQPTRNFPLKIENFDTSGKVHYVCGIDLSSGNAKKRVRVFLRDMKSDKPGAKSRPGIIHYATNPYAGLSEADFRNPGKMQQINETLEAKCYTEPGGVLMVQSAFDDQGTGAVSANWLNRISSDGDLTDGSSIIISPAIARLSKPWVPKDDDAGSTYCYVEVLHPEKATVAQSTEEVDEQLFNALSISPSPATGKYVVAVRVVVKESGKHSTQLLERKAEKGQAGYENESPATTVNRFWETLSPNFASKLKAGLQAGAIDILVIPGTRYRLVGKSLEAVAKDANKRLGLPYERFMLSDEEREATGDVSGFMQATVVLGRFKGDTENPVVGDEDYFVKSVYPLTSAGGAVSLKALVL